MQGDKPTQLLQKEIIMITPNANYEKLLEGARAARKMHEQILKQIDKQSDTFLAHPAAPGRVYMTSDAQTLKFKSGKTAGTTTEEVLEILIHRLRVLQEEQSCVENEAAISALNIAHKMLTMRQAKHSFVGGGSVLVNNVDNREGSGCLLPPGYWTRKAGE